MKIETGKLDVKKYISIRDKDRTTREREAGHREENLTKLNNTSIYFTFHATNRLPEIWKFAFKLVRYLWNGLNTQVSPADVW